MMLVHEFTDGHRPIMVLIHGFLTPWQIWLPQISAFKEKYNIYVIALNAHTEETASEFISISEETEEIIQYFKASGIDVIDTLCGISLGGKIAYEIWKRGQLLIHNLILDGAPLVSCPQFAVRMMTSNYKNIIHKSKTRNENVIANFKKYFLPEKYLDSYFKIVDLMTDKSIENVITSVFSGGKFSCIDPQCRILFVHGTKGNELLSRKSAAMLKKSCPNTFVVCYKGDSHCYKALFQPEVWISTVKAFLDKV